MARFVQFVQPALTDANDPGLGANYGFTAPEQADQLVPDDGAPLDDDKDPELLEALSALYWFRRQEPLEDE